MKRLKLILSTTAFFILPHVSALAQTKDITSLVTHHYANNKTVQLHYVSAGNKNNPAVLFIHGFPDFWYSWRDQMIVLSKDYNVISMDLRGYNLSDHPKGVENYTYDILVQDIVSIINKIGKKPVYLVAHDWGAAIAWRVAMFHPDLIKKLVVLSVPNPKNASMNLNKCNSNNKPTYADYFTSDNFKLQLNKGWFSSRATDSIGQIIYAQAFENSDKDAMINYYKANFPTIENLKKKGFLDRNHNLPNVKVPVLIIHGQKDQYAPVDAHSNTWRFVDDDLSIVVLNEAGHFIQHEESTKVTQLISSFIKN